MRSEYEDAMRQLMERSRTPEAQRVHERAQAVLAKARAALRKVGAPETLTPKVKELRDYIFATLYRSDTGLGFFKAVVRIDAAFSAAMEHLRQAFLTETVFEDPQVEEDWTELKNAWKPSVELLEDEEYRKIISEFDERDFKNLYEHSRLFEIYLGTHDRRSASFKARLKIQPR